MSEPTPQKNFSCVLCDSDIPADEDVKPGDELYCSYCKMPLKVIRTQSGRLVLEAEGEE